MVYTDNLKLSLLSTEDDMTVKEFIQLIAGADGSNFLLIENAVKEILDKISAQDRINTNFAADIRDTMPTYVYDTDNAIANAGGIKAWLEANYDLTPKEVVAE